jgi:hypothetical protein
LADARQCLDEVTAQNTAGAALGVSAAIDLLYQQLVLLYQALLVLV